MSTVSRWKSFVGAAPKRHHNMGRVFRPITMAAPMAAIMTRAGSESPQTTTHTRLLKMTPVICAAAQ
ncbi:MAG: hypothetical protein IT193_16600 [Propionibacteriaceae bacterium]|nr:hypothetical protein [Propionibacteriaceae bacterium]